MKLTIALCVLFIAICAQRIVATTYHTVGDADGWRPGCDYAAWAKAKKFHKGDVLVFRYPEGYGVQEVSKKAMKKCDGSKALYQGYDGNTQIPLKSVGTHFFICADFNMCPNGMNMTIKVTK